MSRGRGPRGADRRRRVLVLPTLLPCLHVCLLCLSFLTETGDLAYSSRVFSFWALNDRELRMRFGPNARPADTTGRCANHMRQALGLRLPIIVATMSLILLPVIAFASPPDPCWIAGAYDGADGDDIVILVYETAAAHAPATSDITLLPCLVNPSLEHLVSGIPGDRLTSGPRAPPARWSLMLSAPCHAVTSPASGTAPPVIRTSLTEALSPRWEEPGFLHVPALFTPGLRAFLLPTRAHHANA